MYVIKCLVYVFVMCFITLVQCERGDDPPATNERYGKDTCCYFAYAWDVNKHEVLANAVNAKFYSYGKYPKHKMAFTEHYDDGKANNFYVTIVEDAAVDMDGIAYLIPIEEFNAYVKAHTVFDGKRDAYSGTVNVELTMLNTEVKTRNCNALFAANSTPQKPCKSDVEHFVELFKKYDFSPEYVEVISQTPSESYC